MKRLTGTESRCFLAFCLAFLLFLPYAVLGILLPETNDDTAMNLIAAGAFGGERGILLYNNVIYGFFLKAFFSLFPACNWYLFFQFLFNFSAVALLAMSVSYFLKRSQVWIAAPLLHFFLAREYYEKIQFTKNSFLYAITGFVLLYMLLHIRRHRKKTAALAVVFLALAMLIRDQGLLMLLPFAVVLLGAAVLPQIREKGIRDWCTAERGLLCALAASLLLCVVFFAVDRFCVGKTAEGKAYREYHNGCIVPLVDRDVISYTGEALAAAGYGMNDIYLLQNYQYIDFDHFSPERLHALIDAKEPVSAAEMAGQLALLPEKLFAYPQAEEKAAGNAVCRAVERFLSWNVLYLVGVLVLLAFCLRKKKTVPVGTLLAFGLLALAEWVFFVLRGYSPRRAMLGPLLAVLLLSALCLLPGLRGISAEEEEKTGSVFRLLPKTIFALLLFEVFLCRLVHGRIGMTSSETELVLRELKSMEGEEYLLDSGILWADRLGIGDPWKITRTEYEGFFEDLILSGGWPAEYFYQAKGAAGQRSPMLELAENGHLHYIVRTGTAELFAGWIQQYLTERCGVTVHAQLVYAGSEIAVIDFEREDEQ